MIMISPFSSRNLGKQIFRYVSHVWKKLGSLPNMGSQMKEVATENFQRIGEAYEILCDETKRHIYDIYGMEGLASGLELGPKLNKAEEIKEELERQTQKRRTKKRLHIFNLPGCYS